MVVKIFDQANMDELVEISYKLRYYTKIWMEHYGCQNRNRMKYWEAKMDEWLWNNVGQFNKVLTDE